MEKRVPNGTAVKEINTNRILRIVSSIKTDNRFGYGIYLYRFEGLADTGFGLYRKEFTIQK